jgi:dienelactone hydrolase
MDSLPVVEHTDAMSRRAGILSVLVAAGLLAVSCGTRAQPAPTGFFASGDVKLSYLFSKPAGRGPFPGVVIGHGSGQTRKEECRYLALSFERRGYATLCYDKRGVGQSTGTYSSVGTANSERMFALLAGDMAAGVKFLAAHPDVDPKRIGLAGSSQAGWIIPLAVATAQPKPAFMIILSGPTVPVGEEIHFSRYAENTLTPVDEAYAELAKFTGPHGFDPVPTLRQVDVRGLWILGLDDRSIPIRDTIRILDDLIKSGKPYRHVAFPGADHSLRGVNIWPAIDEFLRG